MKWWLKRVYERPLTNASILQDERLVTETIKPKIDALLRGHGSVIMGSLCKNLHGWSDTVQTKYSIIVIISQRFSSFN